MTNPRVVPVEIFDWLNQQKKRLPSVDPKRPVEFLQKYPVVKSPNFRDRTYLPIPGQSTGVGIAETGTALQGRNYRSATSSWLNIPLDSSLPGTKWSNQKDDPAYDRSRFNSGIQLMGPLRPINDSVRRESRRDSLSLTSPDITGAAEHTYPNVINPDLQGSSWNYEGLQRLLGAVVPGLAASSNPLAMLAATVGPMVLGELFRGKDPNADRTNELIDMRESAIKDVLAQAKGEAGATQRSPSQIAADRARQQNLAGGKGKGFQKQLAYFSEESAGRDIEARRLAGKQLTVQAASAMKDLIEERKKMSQGYQADVAGIGKILASLIMPETLANQQARLGLLDPDPKVPKVNTELPGQTVDSTSVQV